MGAGFALMYPKECSISQPTSAGVGTVFFTDLKFVELMIIRTLL